MLCSLRHLSQGGLSLKPTGPHLAAGKEIMKSRNTTDGSQGQRAAVEKLFPVRITSRDNREYIIRRISRHDADLLKQIFHDYSEATSRFFHPHPFSDDKAAELCACGSEWADILIVTTVHDPVVGVGYGFVKRGHRPELGIGITDGHQGRGLGGFLMTALKELAFGLGYPSIHLCVYKDNLRAQKLYLSKGFTTDGETEDGKQFTMHCPASDPPQKESPGKQPSALQNR
jgi:RimJ/RimL family protein N-acetyltransferase